ncbi:uncharacterized protein F5Z01DRAFT_750742 [Emericellopsis atlantica]|uniref:MYND-type domain-containing protein n=1 Tax=Emericellopsis atlantica TaxID=2614577 RepID=A0A9P7ZL84_9HYPO|nr:uncharacterized protein F5Z01DRAFT_750742 [Emericellopsis atlantica]KAG9253757.1 hypothetical protein F5Z01DRAFT_750742 [Emericellopsis atlantica]
MAENEVTERGPATPPGLSRTHASNDHAQEETAKTTVRPDYVTLPHCAVCRKLDPTTCCSFCMMIEYCSDDCLKADEPMHRIVCRQFEPPQREPDSRGVPATNIINVEANEGIDFAGTLRILTTSRFGLRHIIRSLSEHPLESKAKLKIYISEGHGTHFARTVAALMCLLPRKGEELEMKDMFRNAEAAIHLAYSAWVREDVEKTLREGVSAKLKSTPLARWEERDRRKAEFPELGLTLVGSPEAFGHLAMHVCCLPEGRPVSKAVFKECHLRRSMDHVMHCEDEHSTWDRMYPARRTGWSRWSSGAGGVLLPHGHPRIPVSKINPIFFVDVDVRGFAAEPLCEWALDDIVHCRRGHAKCDTYGKFFYYVQEQMILFQEALQTNSVEFFVIAREKGDGLTDNLDMLGLGSGDKMDRVEVGEGLLDKQPKSTMVDISSVLKPCRDSPHATAMCLLTHESIAGQISKDSTETRRMESHYLFETGRQQSATEAAFTSSRAEICQMVHTSYANWPLLAVKELSVPPFMAERADGSHGSVILEGFAGLRMRRRHRVIRDRWPGFPMRDVFTPTGDHDNTLARLRAWQACAYPEALQWVEFRKVRRFPSRAELIGLSTQKSQKTFMKRKKKAARRHMARLGPVRLLNLGENVLEQGLDLVAQIKSKKKK